MRRLLIRPGAIGDAILALPAMEHLRAEYTEVWVAPQNVPLIRFADRVCSIPSTGLDMVAIPDRDPGPVMRELAGFDSIVSWYGTNRPEFRQAVAGLPFRFLGALPPPSSGIHAADFFLRQAGGDGTAVPRIECPRSAGGYVAIHPFSGSAKKNWPLDRYREVAGHLDGTVRWCAGPGEELAGAVRYEDLYELACWLAGARLYIGNDSGITHLAAAAGASVVALFGPTDPAIWAPRGERVRIVAAGGPIEQLTAGRVLAALP